MPQIRYAKNVNPGVHALAEYAVVGAQIYQRGVSWGMHLCFDRSTEDEEPIGEVVLVGTWYYDRSIPKRAAVIKLKAEFSRERYRETDDGQQILDTSRPIPVTRDGYVYRFLAFALGEYSSLADAKRWALEAPWGAVTWDA